MNKYLDFLDQDKLEQIFQLQKELDELVGFSKMSYQEQVNNNFMATIHELCEIHDETNWKHWKKTKKEEDRDKKLDELADVFHFIIQMIILHGFNAYDIYNAYYQKNSINRKRVANNY